MPSILSTRLARAILIIAVALSLMSIAMLPLGVEAQVVTLPCGPNDLFGCSAVNVGTGAAHPRAIAVRIIQIAMGFLGLVAVAIILFGGLKWMTGGGNEDKVAEAKKLIGAGIVGLIIIVAAYSIVTYVLTNVLSFVGGPPVPAGLRN